MKRSLLACPLILLATLAAWALPVEISTEIDTHQVPIGGQVTLSVSVKGEVDQSEEPRFPPLEAFTVQQAGASRQITIINGQSAASSVYTYILTAQKAGRFTVPPLDIEVNGTVMHTNPIIIDVTPAMQRPRPGLPRQPGGPSLSYPQHPLPPRSRNPFTPGMPPLAPGQDPWGGPPANVLPRPRVPDGPLVLVEAEASTHTPYVNQPIIYTFRFLHRVNLDGNPNYEPATATGFLREDLGQKTNQAERNGVTYSVSEAKTIFFPTAAGEFNIGATRLTCRLGLEDLAAFDNFSSLVDTTKELVAQSIPITVRPLPTRGRPSDFTGGVGSFTIKANLDKTSAEQGQEVTLRIEVEGDGHPDLISEPTMPQSDDFKFYRGKSESTIEKNGEFRGKKIFSVPVVPLKSGSLKLPALSFSYFDPKENRYETAVTQPLAIQVRPSTNPAAQPSSTPTPGASESPAPHDELSLRGLKEVSRLTYRSSDVPAWAWFLQVIPWLALALYHLTRRATSWAQARSQAHHSSNLGKRTLKALQKLSGDRIEEASVILYGYLEAKLETRLSGSSLQDLSRHLAARGIPGERCRELSRLLGDLEAHRYSPRGDATAEGTDDLRSRAAQIVTQLEQSL